MNRRTIFIILLVACLGALIFGIPSSFLGIQAQSVDCDVLGWFPDEIGLKDHSVFIYDGYYYVVSINVPVEEYFAYARSQDLCHWEDLSPVLTRQTGYWDNVAIWAPHVIEDNGVYYMYYTGVKGPYPNLTQSIMLATSIDPSDPDSWIVEGMVFQPDHPGMVWSDNAWSDCRDPMVLKEGDTYYLYYTGRDVDGGIIGLATSALPNGPWYDWGSIQTFLDAEIRRIPESPLVFVHDGFHYLFYNSNGEHFRIGASPGGPWSKEYLLKPGWAHEVWLGQDNQTYTSFLTNYTVTISRLIWDDFYLPAHPFIGDQVFHLLLPQILR